jgi:hypothetical protein
MNLQNIISFVLAVTLFSIPMLSRGQEAMDKLWGDSVVKLRAENAE